MQTSGKKSKINQIKMIKILMKNINDIQNKTNKGQQKSKHKKQIKSTNMDPNDSDGSLISSNKQSLSLLLTLLKRKH